MIDKNILVVEDEKPLAEAVKIKLKKFGFGVVVARTVDQAFSHLEELKKVEAVWLDHYLLGKKDGLDFVVKLKNKEGSWKDIPIFVVSNTASPDKIQSYIRLGINKYYVKSDNKLEDIINDIKEAIKDQ